IGEASMSPRQLILPRSESIPCCFFRRISVRSASSTTAFWVGRAVSFCASRISSSSMTMLVLNDHLNVYRIAHVMKTAVHTWVSDRWEYNTSSAYWRTLPMLSMGKFLAATFITSCAVGLAIDLLLVNHQPLGRG